MIKIILEKSEISAKELRDFLEMEYGKRDRWNGWKEMIDRYRRIGMGEYADMLIKILDLNEFLCK